MLNTTNRSAKAAGLLLAATFAAGLLASQTSQAAPGSAAIAAASRFTPIVAIAEGQELAFSNLDASLHTLTATATDADGDALFDSGAVGTAELVTVDTTELETGSYEFYCAFHTNMTGTLLVQDIDPASQP